MVKKAKIPEGGATLRYKPAKRTKNPPKNKRKKPSRGQGRP
jgi:hypothetical protein